MSQPRLPALLFTGATLLAAGASWGTLEALPVREQASTLLDATSARPLLERHFDLYEDGAQNAWSIDRICEGISARAASGETDSPSLRTLVQPRIRRAQLPPADALPLTRLRDRLAAAEGRGDTTTGLLSEPAVESLSRELERAGVVARNPAAFLMDARRGLLAWTAGWLFVAAALYRRSSRQAVAAGPAWGMLVVVVVLSAIGLLTQGAVAGPLSGPLQVGRVGLHFAFACGIGGILVLMEDRIRSGLRRLPEAFSTGALALWAAVLLTVVLAVFGTGPLRSLAKINLSTPLGFVQPLEAIKLLILLGVAQFIGRHRHNLVAPRVRLGGRWWPDPRLLLPFGLAAFALVAAAAVLHDIGAVMVVATAAGLLLIAVGGRSSVLAALLGGLGVGIAIVTRIPWEPGSKIASRLAMWKDAWFNGIPGGDQVAAAAWAMAMGGLWGQGVEAARPEDLPAAHTDLVLAYIASVRGFVGVAGILALLGLLLFLGFGIVARTQGERGERRLVPLAILILLASQVLVSTLGAVGFLPLTGVVFPFLSAGGSAVVLFVASLITVAGAGVVARRQPDRPVAVEALHRGMLLNTGLIGLLLGLVVTRSFATGVARGDEIAAHQVITETGDGEMRVRYAPEVLALRDRVRRPRLLDAKGVVMAETLQDGSRSNPFGASISALLSPTAPGYTPLPGTLEAMAAEQHPVFGLVTLPVQIVDRCPAEPCAGAWESVGVVSSDPEESAEALEAFRRQPGLLRTRTVEARDLSELARAARQQGARREELLDALNAGVPDLVSSIDASLQADIYAEMEPVRLAVGASAVAVVVERVSTGEVVVQASGSAGDPADFSLASADDLRWSGPFGWLRDQASRLFLPPGSTWKPITALAALEAGIPVSRTYLCEGHPEKGRQGSLRIRLGDLSGWIRDHSHMRAHGTIDMARAMTVSCNVYFGQLALETGPVAMRRIAAALGVRNFEVPDGGGIGLAVAGFGQGRTLVSPRQLADAYAAIASGGILRRCPLLHAEGTGLGCTEERLASEASSEAVMALLDPVVNGPGGTGHAAAPAPGETWTMVGKTGTAEQPLVPGEPASTKDHAWFAGIVQGEQGESYAVTVLVARGGGGGATAAPLAGKVARLLQRHGYLDRQENDSLAVRP